MLKINLSTVFLLLVLAGLGQISSTMQPAQEADSAEIPENKISNYFIKLSFDRSEIEIGKFTQKLGIKAMSVYRTSEITKEIIASHLEFENDSCEILLYLHCWLGNERTFHKITLKGINNNLEQWKNGKIRKIVSVIWQPTIGGYPHNWGEAFESGRYISDMLLWISELYEGRVSVFCHSMGNRLFEGMVTGLGDRTKQLRLKNVVLVAADLNADIFDHSFSELPRLCSQVHVLKHTNDRLLFFSKVRLQRRRLGLSGPDDPNRLFNSFPNLYVIDVTRSNRLTRPDPSNHVYFHWNTSVREFLGGLLCESGKRPESQMIYLHK